MTKAWFEAWFDTGYYHLLYQHRDDAEAARFLNRLFQQLGIKAGSNILDVACGKGRHSIVMAGMGMNVTGIDLSPNSIEEAAHHTAKNLHFYVHDMREPFADAALDIVVNLFTSFGYSETEADDLKTIKAAYAALKPGGLFIQDYLNALPVLQRLPEKTRADREGIHFDMHKYYDAPFIKKDIRVQDAGNSFAYREQVKAYSSEQLRTLHIQAGFQVEQLYGCIDLLPFNPSDSDRIILISRK